MQERLSERELLTRVAVGLIRATQPLHPNALQPLRTSIYAFKTDFMATMDCKYHARRHRQGRADRLAGVAYTKPTVRNIDDTSVSGRPGQVQRADGRRTTHQRDVAFPGRIMDRAPILGPTLSASAGAPAASEPTLLPRSDGNVGILLAAPVYAENGGPLNGFITFSYKLGPLMLSNDEPSLFIVTLRDPRNEQVEFAADPTASAVGPRRCLLQRQRRPLLQGVAFGGRDYVLSYYAKVDPTARAQSLAAIVMIVGVALTSILCGLFGYVAYNNLRLSREIEARIGFEARLSSVIAELNHRVKNVLAVIQSIVTRTMRPGADVDRRASC